MNKDPLHEKIPNFSSFKATPFHVVAYVLLLYFVYKEFSEQNKCKQLEVIVVEYKIMNQNLSHRVESLENYIDILTGANSAIRHKLDSTQLSQRR